MVKKSKLLAALDAHRGRDYDAEKRKKQLKAGEKAKSEKAASKAQRTLDLESADGADVAATVPLPDSDADQDNVAEDASLISKVKSQSKTNGIPASAKANIERNEADGEDDEDEEDEEEEEVDEEEEVALSELSESEREDTVPHQRMTINNGPALIASTSRVSLLRKHPQKERAPFHIHNSLISTLPTVSSAVADPNDDLIREQEFYKVARAGVMEARSLLKKEGIPFSRPADYFAEMVKSEGHMERIHKKQYDEAADRKGREEARRLRDAKKFGKQVQVAKEQERAKQKRETLDKIKDLKRKRKGNPGEDTKEADTDLFDVGVEAGPDKSRSGRERGSGGPPGAKRQKKDSKYGFGGKKRFAKSGDAESSADMRGFSSSRMKGKGRGGGGAGAGAKKRPGKSRRASTR